MRMQHLINGRPVDSRDTLEIINPATQAVLAEVAAGGADEVNAAVAAAKAAFPAWAGRPATERAALAASRSATPIPPMRGGDQRRPRRFQEEAKS